MSELLKAFRAYRSTVDEAFDSVEDCILQGDNTKAAEILTAMTQVHARQAVGLRALATKANRP